VLPHLIHLRSAKALVGALLSVALLATGGAAADEPGESGGLDSGWSADGLAGLTTRYRMASAPFGAGGLYTGAYRDTEGGATRISRYGADGELDPAFGIGGSVLRNFTPSGGISYASHIETIPGKLLLVGDHYNGSYDNVGITKLLASGAYDTTFAGDGRVTYRVFKGFHDVIVPFEVERLPSGKIVIALAALDFDPGTGDLEVVSQAIIRLNTSGSLDKTFSGDGKLPISRIDSDVAVLPSGAMFVGRPGAVTHDVRRLHASGAVDRSFSGDGKVVASCGAHYGALIEDDPTGRPVLLCLRESSDEVELALFRYTTTGAPDLDYSDDGRATLLLAESDINTGDWFATLEDDAKPWAATRSTVTPQQLNVQTFDATGTPDPEWSDDGASQTALPWLFSFNALEVGPTRVFPLLQRTATMVSLVALARADAPPPAPAPAAAARSGGAGASGDASAGPNGLDTGKDAARPTWPR
jgi:uncharacterized delta-60 repeat protein